MSLAFSIIALLGIFVSPSLAQNGTNATFFSLPGNSSRLTTVKISYTPRPLFINGTQQNYNLTLPQVTRNVAYTVEEGLAIIDGDIIFGTEAELLAVVVDPNISKRGHNPRRLPKRGITFTRDDTRKWPGGVIQYYWQDQASKDSREKDFLAAVKIWTDRLPFLKFVNKGIKSTTTLNGPIILFADSKTVSRSPVGRSSSAGSNKMKLGAIGNPPAIGVYVHEIGHTLGLLHEQQRADWSSYLKLDCSRVCGEYHYKAAPNDDQVDFCDNANCSDKNKCTGHGCNFVSYPATDPEWDWSGPYDVLSIMQYGAYTFSRPEGNWLPPLQPVNPQIPLRNGNGNLPTLHDSQKICAIYHEDCRGVCGDGILSPNNGEECDDGNNVDGDGCSANCKLTAVCGNGKLEAGEECDDGNTASGDGCSATCRKEFCGDGVVQPGLGEECDAGPGGSATCTATCKKPCIKTCNPDPRFNVCDITTSCVTLDGATGAGAGQHYCACAHGFRAASASPATDTSQLRLPWVGQEGRVFVNPGTACNVLCDQWTLGRDGCKEVTERAACY